jgi:hypothetical protein
MNNAEHRLGVDRREMALTNVEKQWRLKQKNFYYFATGAGTFCG